MKAFYNIHPKVSMFYFVFIMVIAVFVPNPVILSEALIGALAFCLILERKREFLKSFLFYIPLLILISVTNPLFSHNGATPLFFMNGNAVTLEALIYGVFIAGMMVGVMYWSRCYTHIMTSDKFIYIFGRVIPKLSLIISMALSFIPKFKRQIKRVNQAQRAMGLYSKGGFSDKLKSGLRVFYVMITWSLENAADTGDSMRARGYGLKGRTSFSLFKFEKRDGLLAAVMAVLSLSTVVFLALGYGDFYFYPRISALNKTLPAIAFYTSFGLLSILPFIIELGENIKWKYFVSKISPSPIQEPKEKPWTEYRLK